MLIVEDASPGRSALSCLRSPLSSNARICRRPSGRGTRDPAAIAGTLTTARRPGWFPNAKSLFAAREEDLPCVALQMEAEDRKRPRPQIGLDQHYQNRKSSQH
jgi:hypothetical protein